MRDAATVILLREGAGGLQVYLLQRVQTMAFASGMHVFPGGTVDPRDAETAVPLPERWPERLHADPVLAAALVSAAIRETFEETGVLVATTAQARPSWESDRLALLRHETSLAQVLRRRNATVQPGALRVWSHWVTPAKEPRRYDTRFFVAPLPAGQEPRHVGGEAASARWIRPQEAVRSGLPMLPPTRVTLTEIAAYERIEAVLQAADRRTVEPCLRDGRVN